MNIPISLFEKLLFLPADQQETELATIGFNVIVVCDEYIGKIVDEKAWLEPELDIVETFFERTVEDCDERIELYKLCRKLTPQEISDLKEYIIHDAQENEYHPGLFAGTLRCGDGELTVIAERTGGGWDCEAKFIGVYDGIDAALQDAGGILI